MSVRFWAWRVGLILAAMLAAAIGFDWASRRFDATVLVLTLTIIALVAKLFGELNRPIERIDPTILERAQPADGVVELIAIRDVRREFNSIDPRLGRFLGLIDDERSRQQRSEVAIDSPMMFGRVALVSIFIDLDGRKWTDREIAQGYISLERAGLWIEREAARRSAPVNIVLASVYIQAEETENRPITIEFSAEGDGFGPMEADAVTTYLAMASRAAARHGFSDIAELVARMSSRTEADSLAWLLHLRGAGRSMAIPSWNSAFPGIGLAVCFSREANFPEPLASGGRVDPLTIVHEMLHLYGATDKYGVNLDDFQPGSVTRDEVMRMDHESLSRLRIDDMTASEIGWGDRNKRRDVKKPAGDRYGRRREDWDSVED